MHIHVYAHSYTFIMLRYRKHKIYSYEQLLLLKNKVILEEKGRTKGKKTKSTEGRFKHYKSISS